MSVSGRLKWALLAAAAALLAGCESMPGSSPQGSVEGSVSSGTVQGEVGDPRNRARVHTELAALYFQRGNMAVALEELRIATQSDPNFATAHSMFGLVYMELREPKMAQQSFERAIRLSPNDPDINHNYGRFLCQSGRENESIKYFLIAVRNPLYPAPWRSYTAAGTCALRKDNVKDAEAFFQRALQLEPDDPSSLLQLGQIRYRNGALEDARKLVARYNRVNEPTAESLWLALRIERKLGEKVAENAFANQLRRRFTNSQEYQRLQRGDYD